MSEAQLTKTTGALLVAVRDHVEQLVGGKHVDASKLRFTVAAQQEQAKKLVGAGLSMGAAAKQLGVSKTTVHRALQSGTKSFQKGTTKTAPQSKPPTPKPSVPDPEEERKQQRWAATSNLIARR